MESKKITFGNWKYCSGRIIAGCSEKRRCVMWWAVSNFKTMSSTGTSLLQLQFIDRLVSSLALWAEQDQLLLGRPELCLAQRLSSDGAA